MKKIEVINSITTTVTAAQLAALAASPVELIPAPDSGKMLIPLVAILEYEFNSAPFSVPGGAVLNIGYSLGSGNAPFAVQASGLLNQLQDKIFEAYPQSPAVQLASAFDGVNVVLSGPNFASGDGSLIVTVIYTAIALG